MSLRALIADLLAILRELHALHVVSRAVPDECRAFPS